MEQTGTSAKRAPNFTTSEKSHLINIIAQKFSKILEDKKTDRTSVEMKIKTWKEIEKLYNASSPNSCYREWSCLKRFYENRKKDVRKIAAKERQETFKTGGGSKDVAGKDSADEILLSIMNKKTTTGLINTFDSDNIPRNTPADTSEISVVTASTDEEQIANNDELQNFQPAQNYDLVRNVAVLENEEVVKHEPVQKPPIVTHCSSKVALKRNRRRPTNIVKTFTSSDVAQKYNLLLDRRLELIDLQKQQIKEEQRKRNLEIQLLELEIQLKQKALQQ